MKLYRIALNTLVFIVLITVLATSATATANMLLFVPDNSSVSGYAECVDVDIYTDINETDQARATTFNIEYDPNCIADYPVWTAGTDWHGVTYSSVAPGICRFTTSVMLNPPISGHKKVGTLTICCNSSTCCNSPLNFTNACYTSGDMTGTVPAIDNGVFMCGPAGNCGDLDENGIINILDVRLLMKNVTQIGYPVDPYAGDVNGDNDIDGDDVRLLLMYMFDPAGHPLNCTE